MIRNAALQVELDRHFAATAAGTVASGGAAGTAVGGGAAGGATAAAEGASLRRPLSDVAGGISANVSGAKDPVGSTIRKTAGAVNSGIGSLQRIAESANAYSIADAIDRLEIP